MADLNDSPAARRARTLEDLEVPLRSLDSVALARLIQEVQNDGDGERISPTAYNRTYHRHNR